MAPPAQISEAWTETVLYSFRPGGDGAQPIGTPVFNRNGTPFGATSACGAYGFGTVFLSVLPTVPGEAWTEWCTVSGRSQPRWAYGIRPE